MLTKEQKIEVLKVLIHNQGQYGYYSLPIERQAQQWLAELEGEDDGWIRVSDRLPDIFKYVLAYYEAGQHKHIILAMASFDDEQQVVVWTDKLASKLYGITHWKPIAPPSE